MEHDWQRKEGLVGLRCRKCHIVAQKKSLKGICPGWPEPPQTIVVGTTKYVRADLVETE